MQSYSLKLADRAEGPYTEAQLAQFYANGRIDRHTPCRLASGGDWKTIDDFLPMLKYGTQLPVPTAADAPSPRVSLGVSSALQPFAAADFTAADHASTFGVAPDYAGRC